MEHRHPNEIRTDAVLVRDLQFVAGRVAGDRGAEHRSDVFKDNGTVKLAILQLVGHWYENRETTILPESGTGLVSIPYGVDAILQAYTIDACTYES